MSKTTAFLPHSFLLFTPPLYIYIYIYVLDFSLLLLLSCASQSLITALLCFLRATSHLQRSLLIYLLLFRSVTLIPTVLCFPLFFFIIIQLHACNVPHFLIARLFFFSFFFFFTKQFRIQTLKRQREKKKKNTYIKVTIK